MNVITKYITDLKNLSRQYQAEALPSIAAVMLLALATTIHILDSTSYTILVSFIKNKTVTIHTQNLLLEKVPPIA